MNGTLLVSLIGFAFVSSITPGPNNLLLMSSGALFGWRRSLPHLGGVLLGFAVVMTSAVFGLGKLVEAWPWLLTAVRLAGAAWLLWMSVRYFSASVRNPSPDARMEAAPVSRPFRFFEAVLFQWINPKAIILALSSAGAYIALAELAWQRAAIIVGVFFITGVVSCSTWMIAGNALNRWLAEGRSAKWANAAMGLLIVATAALILFG
jgi:threonine/homoserine/homoserine lactone efflux protein